jgi:hypothetical protein
VNDWIGFILLINPPIVLRLLQSTKILFLLQVQKEYQYLKDLEIWDDVCLETFGYG